MCRQASTAAIEALLAPHLQVNQDLQGLPVPVPQLLSPAFPGDDRRQMDVSQVFQQHPALFPAVFINLRHRHPLPSEVPAQVKVGVVFI